MSDLRTMASLTQIHMLCTIFFPKILGVSSQIPGEEKSSLCIQIFTVPAPIVFTFFASSPFSETNLSEHTTQDFCFS